MGKIIVTSILSNVFFLIFSVANYDDSVFVLFILSYVFAIAFIVFSITEEENKNGCLIVLLGLIPILSAIILLPFSIPLVIYFTANKNNKNYNKSNKILSCEFDKTLRECKQKGSLEDIEGLKQFIDQNIKYNGSKENYLELVFTVAKVYNYLNDVENATKYFNEVKKMTSELSYQELCLLATRRFQNRDFCSAIYFYNYLILNNKIQNIRAVPDFYYKRALAHLGLNYKYKAIEDLKVAITKAKEIADTVRDVHAEAYLEVRLNNYNYKIAEIYKELQEYQKANEHYNNVSKSSPLYEQAQLSITNLQKATNTTQENTKASYVINSSSKTETNITTTKKSEQAETYFKLALKKRKEYDYEGAIEYFDKAIRLDSKNAKYYYEKSLVYKQNYNPNKAKDALNKAIEIEPDNALYYYARAEISYFQKHNSVAVNDYEKGYELDSTPSKEILNHMQNCLFTFLNNGRPNSRHFYLYAKLLMNKNDAKDYTYQIAINELDKAIKREPLYEYYVLRVYARYKYLLMTKGILNVSSEFESLINDLEKTKETNENNHGEPHEFLMQNYDKLLDFAGRKKIEQSLRLRLGKLNKTVKDDIEKNKINTAWLQISSPEQLSPKELANNYYIVATDFYNKKQVSKAKYYIQKAIEISSLKKYSDLLTKILNKENEKWNSKMLQAEKHFNNKKLDDARVVFDELIKMNPESEEVKNKYDMVLNLISQSKHFYRQGLKKFKNGYIKEAKKEIDSAKKINSEKQSLELYNDIVKYEKFIEEFDKANYNTAYKLIEELLHVYPESHLFSEKLEMTSQKLAEHLYQISIKYVNDGSFDEANKTISEAIKLYPDNDTYKNVINIATNKIVDIKTCNKGAILTLEGFDDEKANQFIKDRITMNWYDMDSFANYFNLQPHEQVMIAERIVFPLKPQVKKGRAVEW
ncbi:MAG: hypothetical protein NC200_02125 [Candidatus Gastranaerophilales bacterium]|nr:hypothetical protein [Candidatus Gastranaerophilales bacterium]